MKQHIPLRTNRLVLREFVEADWTAVHEYASDPEVVAHVPFGPNTEQETRDFVGKAINARKEQPRREYELAVTLKTSGRLIGGCGLYARDPEFRQGYIGYVLNRHFWGQGYASELAGALLAFGFGELKLHRIVSTCNTANAASARVMEKNGMRREGLFLQSAWEKGRWRDTFHYAILQSEWKRDNDV